MSVMSETVPAAPHAAVTAVAGGPFLRNTWYVAAWSHELPPGALLARTIAGEALVLWRTASGSIAALEDRCCHRQAPLSCGRVEADGLRCGYHGLKFAPDGRCIEVPGLDRVPPAARVRRYAVVEHRHWVMESAAVAQGRFHIHTAERAGEGLELLTGRPYGSLGPGGYPAGSVLGQAQRTLQAYRRACQAVGEPRASASYSRARKPTLLRHPRRSR